MPSRKDQQQPLSVLPGFESTVVSARPGEHDLSDGKRYTGEVLFRDHPDVFKAVAAAFFLDGLSVRATAARYRVSVNTVRAIRDMALEGATSDAGRAAFFILNKAERLQGIVRTRALEAIYDRLANPAEAAKLTVDTLLQLAHLGTESKKESTVPASAEVIDVDEFDDMLNGLDAQKKSVASQGATEDGIAPDSPSESSDSADDSTAAPAKKCSTTNHSGGIDSFALSDNTQCLKGFNDPLSNYLGNQGEKLSSRSAADVVGAAEEGAPVRMGGGGYPGVRAGGGVN